VLGIHAYVDGDVATECVHADANVAVYTTRHVHERFDSYRDVMSMYVGS